MSAPKSTRSAHAPLAFGAILLALASGCGLPLAAELDALSNSCEASSGCGADGVCLNGMCVSTKADLTGLVLQVDIPAASRFAAGTSTLIDLSAQLQGEQASGYYESLNLVLKDTVELTAQFTLSQVPEGCEGALGADNSVPISLQVTPSNTPLGIPLTAYSTESESSDDNAIALNVPPGNYDLFFRPAISDPKCQVPPTLLKNFDLSNSQGLIVNSKSLPKTLKGDFDAGGLGDWTVELLEDTNGRTISTRVNPEGEEGKPASFLLQYWDDQVGKEGTDVVIRLTPPDEAKALGMPVMFWPLASVDLDNDGNVELNVNSLISAAAATGTGSVISTITKQGVPATIYIQSTSILAANGFVSYKNTVNSDASGDFVVTLLPGSYRMVAVPSVGTDLAMTEATWDIPDDKFGNGRTISVNPKTSLTGVALTPQGAPAYEIPTLLAPAGAEAETYLYGVLTASEVEPNSATTVTGGNGSFALAVDPGMFDMSMQPPQASQMPWLVRPRVTIKSNEPNTTDLGTLPISNPVVLHGTLSSPFGEGIEHAVIRAWLAPESTSDNELDRPTAIQIAETTADENGRYTLLLPASISQ